MKVSLLIEFIQAGLDMDDYQDVVWEPGPTIPNYPNKIVVLTPYGGVGLEAEGLLDNVAFQIRTIGDQNDYDSAEDLAWAIDRSILTGTTQTFHDVRFQRLDRVGNPPSVLTKDDADRTHFVCSYIATVESGIAEPVGDRS